jgi:transposase
VKKEFLGCSWLMSDAFWRHLQPLLPKYRRSPRGGRPRVDVRQVMNGIFYVLRTGCQWKAVPSYYGSVSLGASKPAAGRRFKTSQLRLYLVM